MPKSCTNITFPHQQDFISIRSVTKSSTARFSHENLVEKIKIFVQDFVPIRTALRGRGGGSFLFIYFIFLPVVLVFLCTLVVYFVCAPASEFGAMGSTSFLGFSYPNLLLVFLNLLFFRNLYHIFLAASVWTLSGSFLFYRYFSVPYFGLA